MPFYASTRTGLLVPRPQGLVYPLAVLLAGAQAGWDRRAITGPQVPPSITCDPTTSATGQGNLPSGWAYNATFGILSTAAGATLDGYLTNGRPIFIAHNGCTVRNCKVTNNGSIINGYSISIAGTTGSYLNGTTISYNEIDGQGEGKTSSVNLFAGISEHATSFHENTVLSYNYIHGNSDDAIQVNSAGTLIECNRLCVGGWNDQSAHWDACQIQNVQGPNTKIIYRRNFVDVTPGIPGGAVLGTSYGRTSVFTVSNCPGGVEAYENMLGFGADVIDAGNPGQSLAPGAMQNMMAINAGCDNIDFHNNVMEWGTAVIHPDHGTPYNWASNFRLRDASAVATPAAVYSQWQREDGTFWSREDFYGWLKETI